MTFNGIKVTHESLKAGSSNMRDTFRLINERLTELEGQLQLLRNDWSGGQQAAYHEAKTKWDTAMNEMGQLLNETAQAVETSQQDYSKADSDGAKRFM
jgi:WXG100 family type VII secretion target